MALVTLAVAAALFNDEAIRKFADPKAVPPVAVPLADDKNAFTLWKPALEHIQALEKAHPETFAIFEQAREPGVAMAPVPDFKTVNAIIPQFNTVVKEITDGTARNACRMPDELVVGFSKVDGIMLAVAEAAYRGKDEARAIAVLLDLARFARLAALCDNASLVTGVMMLSAYENALNDLHWIVQRMTPAAKDYADIDAKLALIALPEDTVGRALKTEFLFTARELTAIPTGADGSAIGKAYGAFLVATAKATDSQIPKHVEDTLGVALDGHKNAMDWEQTLKVVSGYYAKLIQQSAGPLPRIPDPDPNTGAASDAPADALAQEIQAFIDKTQLELTPLHELTALKDEPGFFEKRQWRDKLGAIDNIVGKELATSALGPIVRAAPMAHLDLANARTLQSGLRAVLQIMAINDKTKQPPKDLAALKPPPRDFHTASDLLRYQADPTQVYSVGANGKDDRAESDSDDMVFAAAHLTPTGIDVAQAPAAPLPNTGDTSAVTVPAPPSAKCPEPVFKRAEVDGAMGEGYGAIARTLRLLPELKGDTMRGFKVQALERGSLLERACLKDSDILLAVNSTQLTEPVLGFELFTALAQDALVILKVERGGQDLTIKIKIE